MPKRIQRVAVLGAGVMGSGIAAHLANANVPVLLLDIVPPNPGEGDDTSSKSFRNRFAAGAVEKMKKQKPAPAFSRAALKLIQVGNFDDDLSKLSECDWVIEVVKEDLAIKQSLFGEVEKHLAEHAVISSNTSGLSVDGMLEGRSESFRKRFLVTHFFNPVRYMKLLELVAGPDTEPSVVQQIHQFGEERLGKGIVYAKDTTNFIANRIGVYGMMKTIALMDEMGLGVAEIDAIFGPAMGRPKSAVFRTADVVGLDTFIHVSTNCYDTLPDDEERDVFAIPSFLNAMVEKGWLGSKSGQGFYKKVKEGGKKKILSLDLATMEYIDAGKPRFNSVGAARKAKGSAAKIAAVVGGSDNAAQLARRATCHVLAYASRRIPEIADDIVNIDRGVRWGFGWDLGPFETWDAIGVEQGLTWMDELGIEVAPWVRDMVASGQTSFYGVAENGSDAYYSIEDKATAVVSENDRKLTVEYLKRGNTKVTANASASIWDLGDGIALLEFHSKMNSVDDQVIKMMHEAVDRAEADFQGLVIGNDGGNFSAGANIMALLMGAKMGKWDDIRTMITGFQAANQRMRYSDIPVVTAPYGLTLGGGAEVAMGGNAIQASAETYMGLVEFGVGLIPGGAGNLQLLRNVYGPFAMDPGFDPIPYISKVFMQIGMAKVATSAEEAREAGFLSATDGITMNRDFLLSDAKSRALGMANAGFIPPRKTLFRLPGPSGRATVEMMLYNMELNSQISAHDRLIGTKLATVITGGDTSATAIVTEDRLLELEAEAFLSLAGEEKTQARLQFMLEKNKPLRN